MSRRYGRLVDAIWIRSRMNTKDARRQRQAGTLFPAFLEPEIAPVVEVVIVPANPQHDGPVIDVELVPVTDIERVIEETERNR